MTRALAWGAGPRSTAKVDDVADQLQQGPKCLMLRRDERASVRRRYSPRQAERQSEVAEDCIYFNLSLFFYFIIYLFLSHFFFQRSDAEDSDHAGLPVVPRDSVERSCAQWVCFHTFRCVLNSSPRERPPVFQMASPPLAVDKWCTGSLNHTLPVVILRILFRVKVDV